MIAVFMFYNSGIGRYNLFTFSKKLVHCALLCFQGDRCILFKIAPSGFNYRILRSNDINKNLDNIKNLPMLTSFIVTFIKKPKKVREFPIKWYTCNEVCRYFSGIDIGWTFNPRHLYQKLFRYKDRTNYELLAHWRRT